MEKHIQLCKGNDVSKHADAQQNIYIMTLNLGTVVSIYEPRSRMCTSWSSKTKAL